MQSKGALTHIYTWVLAFLHIAKQCHQFSKILTIIRFSIYKIDEIPYKYIAYFISIIFLAALFNFKIQILFGDTLFVSLLKVIIYLNLIYFQN